MKRFLSFYLIIEINFFLLNYEHMICIITFFTKNLKKNYEKFLFKILKILNFYFFSFGLRINQKIIIRFQSKIILILSIKLVDFY